jgi:hypothetical protein
MSFKRFDTEDIVVSSDSISSPAWSNNQVTLSTFAYNPDQIGTGSVGGQYYWNVYQTGSAEQSAAIQFSIAYGHRLGSGSIPYNAAVAGKSPSSTVYGQFRTLINGDENTDFEFDSDTPENVFFISVERARFKEKLLPGSLTLKLAYNGKNIVLTDNSLTASVDTYKDSGREYLIYSGAAGILDNTNKTVYGKLYPDIGVVVLNGDLLSSSQYIEHIDLTTNLTGGQPDGNPAVLHNAILAGQNFTLRAEETLSSNYVFVRARNSEFNYSTNPSNISGSGELQHSSMIDTPQAYITAVGLYNDNNDLLAVSKLSTPLLKDFTKEALVRIKLDY